MRKVGISIPFVVMGKCKECKKKMINNPYLMCECKELICDECAIGGDNRYCQDCVRDGINRMIEG